MTQTTPGESRLGGGPIVIHIRFEGVSFDIPLTSLDIGTGTADAKIKRALATRLLVCPDRLDGHRIDRHPDGNLSIRPDRSEDGDACETADTLAHAGPEVRGLSPAGGASGALCCRRRTGSL